MTTIRNNTGGVASIPTVNVFDVANGATVDLTAVVADTGLPLNTAASLFDAPELYAEIDAGNWAVVRGGVDLAPAEGLQALAANAVRGLSQDYQNTIYIDPSGSADNSGRNPSEPTTLAKALTIAGFSTCFVFGEGTYADPIPVTQSNWTFVALQGGTQSNSTTLSGAITIGAGISRFRAFGLRLDGGIVDNGSSGSHYLASCSAGGTPTITRTNPSGALTVKDCDFSGVSYTATGSGTATLVVEGAATVFGAVTCSVAAHTVVCSSVGQIGRITLTSGFLLCRGTRVVDPTLPISAGPGTVCDVFDCRLENALGVAQPITVSGGYQLQNTIYNPTGSTLGGKIGQPSEFSNSVRFAPASPASWPVLPTTLAEGVDSNRAEIAANVYGRGYQTTAEETTPTSITGLAFVQILPPGTGSVNLAILEAGTYEISLQALLSPTSGFGAVGVRLVLDGVPEAVVTARAATAGSGGARLVLRYTVNKTFAGAGNVAVAVEAQEYGVGTFTNASTRVWLKRVQ